MSANLSRGRVVPVIACLFLAGCGSVDPEAYLVPDDPGLYAVTDRDLHRLDGDKAWEKKTWNRRSDMPESIQFVAYDPVLAHSRGGELGLYKVGWIRSDISAQGEIQPVIKGSRWAAVTSQDFQVPMTIDRVAGRTDVIRAIPAAPLEDGLYSLQLRVGGQYRAARIGVNWPQLDHERYAAVHCVDRYHFADEARLRPCEQQQPLLLGKSLRVFLVKPSHAVIDGTETLVVQGVIANTGDRARPMPALRGEIKDANGRVLRRWRFVPETPTIGPGESVPFETRVKSPPAGSKTVNVGFTAPLSARL